MARATIPDIARRAGLSTATVDRALNGRKGVSAANRHRVLKAAEDLGYLPSEGMIHLPSRPAHLVFLIPFGRNAFMHELARSITGFSAGLPLVASCNVVALDGIGADALERALDSLAPQTNGIGLVAMDQPRTRAIIDRLSEAGIRVVTIASDVTGCVRSAYVGADNYAAGRTAGQIMGMLTGRAPGSVSIFFGSPDLHGHTERERGFRARLAEAEPQLRVHGSIETGEDSRRSYRAAVELLRDPGDLRGIYCVGAARTGIVEALEAIAPTPRPAVVIHDINAPSRGWLQLGLVDVVIDQNARLVGEQAVVRLLGSIATATPLLSAKNIEPRIILRENIPSGGV